MYERSDSIVFLPKTAFIGLITVAGLFMVLFAYSFLRKKEYAGSDQPSSIAVDAYRSPYLYFKPYNYDSVIIARNILQAREAALKDSFVSMKGKKAGVIPTKKAKKKRKKFLGIF